MNIHRHSLSPRIYSILPIFIFTFLDNSYLLGKILRFIWNIESPVEKPLKKTALTAGAYCMSTCDLSVGGYHGCFSCLQQIWWLAKKIVASHEDFHILKTAKSDLFRACYHAGFPAWKKTAREYSKLSGGFFCRFKSKWPTLQRCRGPPAHLSSQKQMHSEE